ncbi:MAG: DUF6745 domain-containing protein [Verrucomicrobiota bacterium]
MEPHSLSSDKLALIPQVENDWFKIHLDNAPIDRGEIREILGRLYALANKPAPENFVFCDSPLQISLAIGNLRVDCETVRLQVSGLVQKQVCSQLGRKQVIQTYRQPSYKIFTEQTKAYNLNSHGLGHHYYPAEVMPSILFEKISDIWEKIYERSRDRFEGIKASELDQRYPFNDFGQFDEYLPWFDLLGRCGVDISRLTPRIDLGKACGLGVLFWDWAFISAKPEFKVDEQGILHCETGPSVRYPDGFSFFYLHGVRVPEKLVMSPETITITEIEEENNVEIRRMMIERYGQERFLMESGAEEIHRDDFGILYRKDFLEDQSLVMVKVVNSTPESDGSFKDYFLRVPPDMERAKQAVAWTFGKEENDYSPALQT